MPLYHPQRQRGLVVTSATRPTWISRTSFGDLREPRPFGPGVARADILIVPFMNSSLPNGAEEGGIF